MATSSRRTWRNTKLNCHLQKSLPTAVWTNGSCQDTASEPPHQTPRTIPSLTSQSPPQHYLALPAHFLRHFLPKRSSSCFKSLESSVIPTACSISCPASAQNRAWAPTAPSYSPPPPPHTHTHTQTKLCFTQNLTSCPDLKTEKKKSGLSPAKVRLLSKKSFTRANSLADPLISQVLFKLRYRTVMHTFAHSIIQSLLAKGAVETVPPKNSKSGFYSRYFLIPKKDGGLRPILDLRHLNRTLVRSQFRMLTLNKVCGCSYFPSEEDGNPHHG